MPSPSCSSARCGQPSRHFDHIRSAGRTVLFLNTVPLMDIAFLPFAASVPAAGFRTGHGQRTAVVFHGMTLLLAAILFNVTGVRAIITGCSPPPSIRCGRAPLAGASGWHLFWIATGTLLGGLLPVLGMAVIAAFIPYYWLPIRGETASAKPPGLLGALTADTRRAWPSGRRRPGRRRRLPAPAGQPAVGA